MNIMLEGRRDLNELLLPASAGGTSAKRGLTAAAAAAPTDGITWVATAATAAAVAPTIAQPSPRGEGLARHGGSPSSTAPHDTVGCRSWCIPYSLWPLEPGWQYATGNWDLPGLQRGGPRGWGYNSTYQQGQLGLLLRGCVRFSHNYFWIFEFMDLDCWKFCDIRTCWSSYSGH